MSSRRAPHTPDVNTPGDVGAVADPVRPGHRPTDVEQDRLAGPDDPLAGFVMGARRVGAGRHDGEVHPLVALIDDPTGDLGGHVGFGATDEGHPASLDVSQDPVDGGRRVP